MGFLLVTRARVVVLVRKLAPRHTGVMTRHAPPTAFGLGIAARPRTLVAWWFGHACAVRHVSRLAVRH